MRVSSLAHTESQSIPDVILSKGCVLIVHAIIQTPCKARNQHLHNLMILHGFLADIVRMSFQGCSINQLIPRRSVKEKIRLLSRHREKKLHLVIEIDFAKSWDTLTFPTFDRNLVVKFNDET